MNTVSAPSRYSGLSIALHWILAIALVGFTIFGVTLTVILNLAATEAPWIPAARWGGPSVVNLILAYDLGLIAATGVCLPSFYFYGLLAGVKTSMAPSRSLTTGTASISSWSFGR